MAIGLTLDWNSSPIAEAPRTNVSAADAIVSSLRTFAHVDLAHIAAQMGTTEEEAEQELGSSVFRDPIAMELQAAEEYLSGASTASSTMPLPLTAPPATSPAT